MFLLRRFLHDIHLSLRRAKLGENQFALSSWERGYGRELYGSNRRIGQLANDDDKIFAGLSMQSKRPQPLTRRASIVIARFFQFALLFRGLRSSCFAPALSVFSSRRHFCNRLKCWVGAKYRPIISAGRSNYRSSSAVFILQGTALITSPA